MPIDAAQYRARIGRRHEPHKQPLQAVATDFATWRPAVRPTHDRPGLSGLQPVGPDHGAAARPGSSDRNRGAPASGTTATALRLMLLLSQLGTVHARWPTPATELADAFAPPTRLGEYPAILAEDDSHPVPDALGARLHVARAAAASGMAGHAPSAQPARHDPLCLRVLSSSADKEAFIASLTAHLARHGLLEAAQGEAFASVAGRLAAQEPLLIARIWASPDDRRRPKRASQASRDAHIAEHIRTHCAVENEVFDAEGRREGSLLLVEAQRAENPFRRLYDGKDGGPTPEMRGLANGLNVVADMLTLGIKPLIGKLIANAKRQTFYRSRGDEICAERYQRLSVAELASSLDVSGLASPARMRSASVKPSPLQRIRTPSDDAAYYLRDPLTGVRRELLLEVRPTGHPVRQAGPALFLKPTGRRGEFVVRAQGASDSPHSGRIVTVDEATMTWRYAGAAPDAPPLQVAVYEGRQQVPVYGDHYPIRRGDDGSFEIVLDRASGAQARLPIYREPLSGTWQLALDEGRPVFSAEQQGFIDAIAVEPDAALHYVQTVSNNQAYYGAGKLYRAEKKGDDSHYSYGDFLEMNGRLVPVKTLTTPGHGVHYEAFDRSRPGLMSRRVAFDGLRWTFETATSPQVSPALERRVRPGAFVLAADPRALSAPDRMGLQWNRADESFVRVRGEYLRVDKRNGNRYVLRSVHAKDLVLRYRDGQYFPESLQERLHNLRSVGLGGRKRHHAETILQENGYTAAGARTLLSEYQFPGNGFYSDYEFALYIEQYGSVPVWAERFKKARLMERDQFVTDTVYAINPEVPGHTVEFRLGKRLGEGYWGEVFTDTDDKRFVIKRFFRHDDEPDTIDATYTASVEAEAFRQYYGEHSAMAFEDEAGDEYLRMYRIPGVALHELPARSLPPDAPERYVDMLEKLSRAGIMHSDLNPDNVLWDGDMFYPVDMQNVRETYFNAKRRDRARFNAIDEKTWQDTLRVLREKMLPAAQ